MCRPAIAALVGVCPYDFESGKFKGHRHIAGGRILIGCEGSEDMLAYGASRIGIGAFAYASDYPHEVDLPAAIHEIDEVAVRTDLSDADKQAVLAGNAERIFRV